ncbi:unnamed protein product [Spodoptera littoralis]|uniref:Uncharacterized protein n=1 Tax=Spodoptera littoralis TaxID=7109 RepID=A0A9P0IID4_SPOLI|nr:unnamed protein product [Spodoptera littoralis]CAH1645616.1 unnamed protein product [Spodoptera littoralis]
MYKSQCWAKSVVFDGFFFKYVPEKSLDSKTVAICVKCLPKKTVHIKGHRNSSSNFVSHSKRIHGSTAVEEYHKHQDVSKKQKKRKVGTSSCKNSVATLKVKGPVSQEDFERDLVNYFIHSMIPLRAIENPYFLRMIDNLDTNNNVKIPSRRCLRKKIAHYFYEQKCELKKQLETAKHLCTTTDIWSGKRRSFLGVTIHWIDQNLEWKSASIACRRFKGVHSFNRIKDLLLDIYSDFELDTSKVEATVTDNGSNFVKAFQMFGVNSKSILVSTNDDETVAISDSTDSESEDEIQPNFNV